MPDVESGSTIERVRSQDLGQLIVALPPVEDQSVAISIAQELQLIATEVAKTRAGLWTGPLTIQNAQGFLDRVRGAFAEDSSQASTAPTVESWIEHLINNDTSGEMRASMFGSLPTEFIDSLVAGRFWDVLDAARQVRNERGHGGIEGEQWL